MDTQAIINALVSHAASMGYFESVNTHEIKSAPGNGLTCSVWVQDLGPSPGHSSLIATTALLVFSVRIYTPMLAGSAEQADMIDPALIQAVDGLMTAYSTHFTLGGLVRNVVLLPGDGNGQSLSARAGYVQIGQGMQRIMDINVPMIVNDTWSQNA